MLSCPSRWKHTYNATTLMCQLRAIVPVACGVFFIFFIFLIGFMPERHFQTRNLGVEGKLEVRNLCHVNLDFLSL